MSIGPLLRTLHRIHTQLGDLRERMERGPRQVKIREAAVAKAEAELAAVKNEQKAARMASDQRQLQLKTNEGKIRDLQVKLNQANSNREYQAFRDQIAADEMANSVLADEILEAMEKLESFTTRIADAEQLIKRTKEELAKAQAKVRDEAAGIQTDITRLEAELVSAERELPEDLTEPYFRMSRVKGADALAVLDGQNCGGCFKTLTPNMVNNVTMNKVVFCQCCGRILYLAEDRRVVQGE